MKTYLEKILPHPENPELSVIFRAVEDDVEPSTLGDSYMDESVADEIQLKFYAGNKAAWFTADVVVCKKGDEENLQHAHGKDSLGGCNYHSFEDFLKSEQFTDMIKEATTDMDKNQSTVASSPSWHQLTEYAIVFGTEEQFKLAQEVEDGVATFLPCIIENENGYLPNEDYPQFEIGQCDDGSYEQMLADGEIDPDLTDKDTFLLDCLKSMLEDHWSPELKPHVAESAWVDQDELDGNYNLSKLVKDFDKSRVKNDEGGFSKLLNAGDVIEIRNMVTEDKEKVIVEGFDGLEFKTDGGGKPDTSHYSSLGMGGGYYVENDKTFYICFNKEPSIQVTKVGMAVAVSVNWEEITPGVWVYGTSEQVEHAIQDGDLPCELPCIVENKWGYEPLSEEADYTIDDFLKGLDESSDESRLAQMRLSLEGSYNTSAYSDRAVAEIEEVEEIKDFAVAGPGAGVTINLASFTASFKQVDGILKFEPVLVDVEFNSAYDTQKAEEGLSIQMDDVTDSDEIEVLLNRYSFLSDGDVHGEVRVSAGNMMSEDGRRLVLSPGWSRAQMKAGDTVRFADEDTWLKGTATFTENGQYAWEDLDSIDEEAEAEGSAPKVDVSDMDIDNPDQYSALELQAWYDYHTPQEISWEELEEVNKSFYDKMEQIHQLIKSKRRGLASKKALASDKCLDHTFSDVEFDFDLDGIEDDDFVPPKYDIEVEQCFEYDSDYGADADGNRGMAMWFFGDREILSVSKDGKNVDLKSEEGKVLLSKIEKDKHFDKLVEDHDWNVSTASKKSTASAMSEQESKELYEKLAKQTVELLEKYDYKGVKSEVKKVRNSVGEYVLSFHKAIITAENPTLEVEFETVSAFGSEVVVSGAKMNGLVKRALTGLGRLERFSLVDLTKEVGES